MGRRTTLLVAAALVTLGAPVVALVLGLGVSGSLLALVMGAAYLVPGGVVVVRADGHRVGWLLVAIGALFSLAMASDALLPNRWITWFTGWAFPTIFGLFAVLCLVVPSGRLPGGTGAIPVRMGLVALGVAISIIGLTPDTSTGVEDPVGILPEWMTVAGFLVLLIVLVGGMGALLVRFRRSSGVRRAQLGPVVAAFAFLVVSVAVTFALLALVFPDAGSNAWIPALLSYLVLPSSFSVAVLRYRLYEVGRLVRRTVSYVIVIALLVSLYAVAVLGFDGLLTPVFGAGDLPTALSTLLVFAVFRPVASRIRAWVDHRFNRSGYEAEEVVGRLRTAVRDEIDPGAVADQLADTVVGTLHPSSVAMWVSS